MLYSVMVGLGETYFPLFALALGFGEVASGLVATVPLAAGSLLQLIVPWGVSRLGSNKRWVLICAAAQTLSFVPLIVGAILEWIPLWVVFAASAAYWSAALGAGPAWNPWVGSLIPRAIRASYFGMRTRLCQMSTVAGLAIAGAILHVSAEGDWRVRAYAVMFALAALCRGISLTALSIQREFDRPERGQPMFRWVTRATRMIRERDGYVLVYMVAVTVAVQVSGPFFTPFMARHLGFSWTEITAMMGAAFLAKIIAPTLWARVARSWGVGRLLWIGGLGILPLSLPWVFSDSFLVLIVFQAIGGAMWSAYELATFLALFETIPARERTPMLTMFNLLNSFAMAIGSIGGGVLLAVMGEARDAYLVLFGASFGARLVVLPLLLRIRIGRVPVPAIASRTLSIRPNTGSESRPILPMMEEAPHANGHGQAAAAASRA